MIQGAKKISALPTAALNGTEIVPVVQNQSGTLTTIQIPVTAVGSDTNLANTNLTQTAATNRLYDMNGNILQFDNGQLVVGNALGSPYLMEVNGTGEGKRGIYITSSGLFAVRGEDASGTALNGVTDSGIAVYGLSNNTGIGVHGNATNNSTIAGWFVGRSLIEETSTAVFQSTAIHEVKSTVKGAIPAPLMTTTQSNAIASPATGLEIYNTTTNRKEVYNGSFWQGVATRFIQVHHAAWNPTDGQTVAFGAVPIAPQSSAPLFEAFDITLRGDGVIRACSFKSWASGVAGTNENWSLYVRINSTDYLVQTVGNTSAIKTFANTSLNIPYVDGDILKMIFVNPTWATNPTSVFGQGLITLQ